MFKYEAIGLGSFYTPSPSLPNVENENHPQNHLKTARNDFYQEIIFILPCFYEDVEVNKISKITIHTKLSVKPGTGTENPTSPPHRLEFEQTGTP